MQGLRLSLTVSHMRSSFACSRAVQPGKEGGRTHVGLICCCLWQKNVASSACLVLGN